MTVKEFLNPKNENNDGSSTIIPTSSVFCLENFINQSQRFEKFHHRRNNEWTTMKVSNAERWLISLVVVLLRPPVDWQRSSLSRKQNLRADNQLGRNQRRLTCCRSRSWRWPAAWARSARPAGACRTGSGNATRWGRTSCPALSWTSHACRPADTSQAKERIQYGGPWCQNLISGWGTKSVKLWCRFLGFMSVSVFHNQAAFLIVESQLSNPNQHSKTWYLVDWKKEDVNAYNNVIRWHYYKHYYNIFS